MLWSPCVSAVVVKLACPCVGPLVATFTALVGPPATGWPFSVNTTDPLDTGLAPALTVAVTITAVPAAAPFGAAAFGKPLTVVEVESPMPGVMARHQPEATEEVFGLPWS